MDPIDVWLTFATDEDEEPTYEANTYRTEDGYRIDYYHTAVGQVNSVHLATLAEVHAWYRGFGFEDFSC